MAEITKDVSAFAQQLMEAAGISDAEQQKQLKAIFENDKVKAVITPVLTEATDGIARERGRVTAATKKAEEAEAKMNTYYQDGLKLAERNQAAVTAAEQRVAKYVELYGELPGGGDPNNPAAVARAVNADVIDKKTFNERIATTENNTIGLAQAVMKITAKHIREFPEVELDPAAITKIAQEQGLSAEKAWEVFTQPAREAKQKAAAEKATADAVEAARIEERTRQGTAAVIDSAPRSEFISNLQKQAPPPSAQESFIKGWRDPNAAATMKKEFGG